MGHTWCREHPAPGASCSLPGGNPWLDNGKLSALVQRKSYTVQGTLVALLPSDLPLGPPKKETHTVMSTNKPSRNPASTPGFKALLLGFSAALLLVIGGWYYFFSGPSATHVSLEPITFAGDWAGAQDDTTPQKPLDLSALCAKAKGNPLYVDVWATWCPYCTRDILALATLARQHVALAFVSTDHNSQAVKNFIARHNLQDLDIFMDSTGAFAKTFGVRGLPVIYKFDKNCRMVEKHAGPLDAATVALFFDVNLKNL